MPLIVQQLNADTTFLLTFSETTTPTTEDTFSILIDPWLTGPSPIFHSSFASSSHTTESSIQSLAELEKPPDLVIVSQPKNDHCNKQTLGTLPKSWNGMIIAVPAAARKIRSWKYFPDGQIRVVRAYNAKNSETVIKLPIACSNETSGEVAIANIPEPYDLSAVHNAIGITYRLRPGSSRKPFSILYTPHGLTASLLEPYLNSHLRPSDAYPIDIFFHSLNTEANPKLMGGVVSNGAPSGMEIAKLLGVREWIGAHDEEKTNTGIATKLIRRTIYSVEEVEKMLESQGMGRARVHSLGVGGTFNCGA